MSEKYYQRVATYHYERILPLVKSCDIANHDFKIPTGSDHQITKLMLALDIRRLAEILAVWDAWESSYSKNEQLFHNIAYNDLLDILGRMKKKYGAWPLPKEASTDLLDNVPECRFKYKHKDHNNQDNDEIKRNASSDLQYIFFVTSKILHADEYSVYNHCKEDFLAWPSLIMVGDLACRIYDSVIASSVEAEFCAAADNPTVL